MRICFLSNPNYLHTQRWARFFLKRGHEVCIVGDRNAEPIELPDIPIYILDDAQFKGPWILRTTLALKRLLNQIQPDILHMHYLGALVAPVLLRFKPFVVSVWGADIVGESGLANDPWKLRFLKRRVLRNADAVVALSRFLAKATCQYAGLPPERVAVHYWGVDLQHFSPPRTRKGDARVIGFIKHLLPKYGPEYMLRAIPAIRARHPDIRVLMVGDGVLRQGLEKLARDLRIADAVTFCGRIAHENIPKYLDRMDIFVMPSVYESETFGVAATEAEAMGLPVVATTVGGIPEAVQDGVTGILVPPRDPDAIAAAVLRLIEDKDLRESMSGEGPRFVAQNYDWEKNARGVEDLYRSLLNRHK